jgi:ribonuclease P protein component
VVVPRYKQTAVARNLVKRRLRELVRLELLPGLGAVDVVQRAVPSAYGAPFEALRADVQKARAALPARPA